MRRCLVLRCIVSPFSSNFVTLFSNSPILSLIDERVEYNILQIGTGWDFSQDELDNMEFIGTVEEGPYMWHIFVNQPGKFKEKEKTYDEYDKENNYDHVNMTVNFGGMALG